ncbi:hypothetical protein A2U01_0099174, partial [Trifolium medium]|nr:hypothetical protein [Trifolium medium]
AFPSQTIAAHRATMASGNCHRGAIPSSWHDTAVFLLNKHADLIQFYPVPSCCDGFS